MPPHDQTIRAGRHDYPYGRGEARHSDWSEGATLPIAGAAIGGAILAAWLIVRESGGSHRHTETHDRYRYRPAPRWREHDTRSEHTTYRPRTERSVSTDETRDLIASDKVEGTAVYARNGERLGSVYNFMVGKRSGRVAYAVMSFGGWLGMGESYHPLPWSTLTYDTELDGYVVGLSKDRLRNAPSHRADGGSSRDSSYWERVKNYWT